jgi:hypothetical protein
LKSALSEEFRGRGWVHIEQVHDFVASDKTDYHTSQFKTNALVPMEKAEEIDVPHPHDRGN